MTFLSHVFLAIMLPVLAVTGFLFGNHKVSPPPATPIVLEASVSQTVPVSQKQEQPTKTKSVTTPVVIPKSVQSQTTNKIVDNSVALQKAQQEADNAKIAQQQAEEKVAELQAQQKATQDALDVEVAKRAQADAEAATQAAQQQAALVALQTQQQADVPPIVLAPEVPIITMSFKNQDFSGDKSVEVERVTDENMISVFSYSYKWNVAYPNWDYSKFKCSFSGDRNDVNVGSGQTYVGGYMETGTHLLKITCLDLSGNIVASKSLTIVVK